MIDGKQVMPKKSKMNELYYIEKNGIDAQNLAEKHTFVAGNIQVKNYSALSYAGIMFNSSKANETTRKMLASLYLYWKTAKEYFN